MKKTIPTPGDGSATPSTRDSKAGELRIELAPRTAINVSRVYVDRVVAALEELLESSGGVLVNESNMRGTCAGRTTVTDLRASRSSFHSGHSPRIDHFRLCGSK